jgi:hypothetical protein
MSVNEAHAEVLDRLPAGFGGDQATGLRRYFYAVWHWLPKGQLLPEHIWRRRHAAIVWLLWIHVPALVAFGRCRTCSKRGASWPVRPGSRARSDSR